MYCLECTKGDKKQSMKFAMLNFSCGIWLCPRKDCMFPLKSEQICQYIEEHKNLQKTPLCKEKGSERFTSKCQADFSSKKKRLSLSNKETKRLPSTEVNSDCLSSLASDHWTSDSTTPSVVKSANDLTDSDSGFANSPDRPSSPTALNIYPVWINSKSSCWLDVSLVLLCLNKAIKALSQAIPDHSSLLYNLYDQYESILIKYNQTLMYSSVAHELIQIRNQIWQFLQPRLLLHEGDQDSPLFALPLILNHDQNIRNAVETTFVNRFSCTQCKLTKVSRSSKTILSLPNCCGKFSVPNQIGFMVNCYGCGDAVQNSYIEIDGNPPVIMIHFTQGVPPLQSWQNYNFKLKTHSYTLTQIIQYHNRHFIIWCYNLQDKKWMRYNDLCDKTTRFHYDKPRCPFDEGHILVWERDCESAITEGSLICKPPLSNITNHQCISDKGFMQETDRSICSESVDNDVSFFFSDTNDLVKANDFNGAEKPPINTILNELDELIDMDCDKNQQQECQSDDRPMSCNFSLFTLDSMQAL